MDSYHQSKWNFLISKNLVLKIVLKQKFSEKYLSYFTYN